MTWLDRFADWLWLVFIAVFGWAWRMHDRVGALELHQAYTHKKLESIDTKLDVLLNDRRNPQQ